MICLGDALKPEFHDQWYKKHFDSIPFEYDKAIKDGFIPRAISFKTFKSVKIKLMDAALSARPNAQAIRAISVGKCSHVLDCGLREVACVLNS